MRLGAAPRLGPITIRKHGDRRAAAKQESPLDTEILRLLADPLRIRIVELLATESLCTCHLVVETGASQSNISNHLRVLREAGLVSAEPCGRFTYYTLAPARLSQLGAQLAALASIAGRDAVPRRPC